MMKLANHAVLKLLILFFSLVGSISVAQAAYQRSFINLSFEEPNIANTGSACRVYIDSTKVPGWLTTHPYYQEEVNGTCTYSASGNGQIMELWNGPRAIGGTGTGTISARNGKQFAELNAQYVSEISQNICLVQGEEIEWRFSHNGRRNADTMDFRTGTQKIVSVQTNTVGQGQINFKADDRTSVVNQASNGRWADYSGKFIYTGATGQTTIGFQSTSTTSPTEGNFLDDIQIKVKPMIEFTSANYSIPENSSSIPPIQVFVMGTVPAGGIPVNFTVTDGTATLGTDYTVNGGTARTFTATIPQGTYTTGQVALSVPVQLINDNVAENNETFMVEIEASPEYHVMSASTCGSSGNGTTTYTIIDDDAPQTMNLSIDKTQKLTSDPATAYSANPLLIPVSSGNTLQYKLVVTNKDDTAVSSTNWATFQDVVPSNLTNLASITTIKGGTAVGSDICSASFTGNTLNGRFSGAKGATCTVTFTARPSTAGIITNTATVSVPSPNSDFDLSDNSSSVQTTVARALIYLNKASIGGTGSFDFSLTGTNKTSATVVTQTPIDQYQVDGGTIFTGQPFAVTSSSEDVNISETNVAGWSLLGATCRVRNADGTSGALVGTAPTSGTGTKTYTLNSTQINNNPNINCNFTNIKVPIVKIAKESRGGTGTFAFVNSNLSSTSTNVATSSSSSSTNIGKGTSAALTVNDTFSNVTISEPTVLTGYVLKDAKCTDANSFITGNIGEFGDLSGSTLTISSGRLITGGADITCTFINSTPSLTIKKISRGGVGKFDFTASANSGILNHSVTTTVAETETSGITQYFSPSLSLTNVVLTESGMPTGYRLTDAVCTGIGASSVTVNKTNGTVTLARTGIAAGADIVCTLTNTLTTLTLIKKWENALAGDSATVNSVGFTTNATTGLSVADATGANSTAGTPIIVPLAMLGTTGSIIEAFSKGDENEYVGNLVCTGNTTPLNGNKLTINTNDAAIICTLTNSRKDLVLISGKVFNDNGGNVSNIVANAYNGIIDANEQGIAGSSLKLANCSGVDLNVVSISNDNGDYRFKVEKSVLSNPFCIIQTNLPEYTSVSGVSPTGTYTRNTDTIRLPKTTATSYPNNNFADVKLNVLLTEDGQHTITAGEVTDYPHRLSTQAPVWVTKLEQTQSNSNNDQPWQALVYQDTNCNGTVDTGETVFDPTASGTVLLQPNTDICLVQRVFAPTNIFAGAQHIGTLQASYAVSALNLTDQKTQQRQDVTLIGSAGLTLTKKVRAVTSCSSTPSDSLGFLVNNEATKQQNLEYEITYKNNSVKNLQNVKVKDSLPTGTNFGSVSCRLTPSGNTCNATRSGEVLEWTLTGMLKPSATGTLRFCVSQ
ncbi:Calx-beta domain-containing protein [Acinetobacter baumannii]|nr:Calx-beta domain-containing protein [Acinetobacter baumannii]